SGHCLSVFPDFKPLPAFGTEVATVHGVVPVPGRPYVILNHEGTTCPFGGITIAYIGNKDAYNNYDKQTGAIVGPAAGDAGSLCADAEVDGEGVPVRVKGLIPPDIEARSYPITMNGYIVYSDSVSGLFVLKYTGPHASEIPAQGTCVAQNPNVQAIGYEPCKP